MQESSNTSSASGASTRFYSPASVTVKPARQLAAEVQSCIGRMNALINISATGGSASRRKCGLHRQNGEHPVLKVPFDGRQRLSHPHSTPQQAASARLVQQDDDDSEGGELGCAGPTIVITCATRTTTFPIDRRQNVSRIVASLRRRETARAGRHQRGISSVPSAR